MVDSCLMHVNLIPQNMDVAEQVGRDIETSSRTGAPLLGCLAGLTRVGIDRDKAFALALDPARPAMLGQPGFLEVAMLADLALGGAIREDMQEPLQLPTVSLTVEIDGQDVGSARSASASAGPYARHSVAAAGNIYDAHSKVIGRCQALFAVPQKSTAVLSMPWERIRNSSGQLEQSRPGIVIDAASVIKAVTSHAASTPEETWSSQHVKGRIQIEEPSGVGTLSPDTTMLNRAGFVQGAVLFTFAVQQGATISAGFELNHLATVTMDFVAPARADNPILSRAFPTGRSGRTLFLRVELTQAGRVAAQANLVFRR